MLKKMSLKAKIIAGISTALVTSAVVVVVIIQANGGINKTDPSTDNKPVTDTNSAAPLIIREKSATTSESTQTTTPSTGPTTSTTAPSTQPGAGSAAEQPTETFYARIASWSERMLPYETSFALDYVDWLKGQEALDMYILDHPGCTPEQAQFDIPYGYIRNADPEIEWYVTTENTLFYLRDETAQNAAETVQVDYHTFLTRMIPAIDNNNVWLTFVKVTVSGESIVEIEWVYTP